MEELINFFKNPRDTISSYHFKIAREWRIFGQEKLFHAPLVYSAFEYRMSIERYLFEFYIILKGKNNFTQASEKEAVNIDRLIKAIYKFIRWKGTIKSYIKI